MNRITRRILHLVVWGCAFFVFAVAAWVGFCWLKRPPYLVPDTSAFATGDVFFSVGDAWESVAVRALSGYTSFEVCDYPIALRHRHTLCRRRASGACVYGG